MCNLSPDIIISGVFGLAGVALGGGIGYASALLTNRTFAVREAANNLRAAFAPQLSAFRLDQEMSYANIESLLGANINSLTIEMEKFRFYIGPENLSAYDDACKKYQSIARIRAMNYEAFGGKKPFKVFEAKVNDVLQFAKL